MKPGWFLGLNNYGYVVLVIPSYDYEETNTDPTPLNKWTILRSVCLFEIEKYFK